MKKRIIFVVSYVNGGVGRVIGLLANGLISAGYDVTVIFTEKENDANFCHNERIEIVYLDNLVENKKTQDAAAYILMFFARAIGKFGISEYSSIYKFYSKNYNKISALKKYCHDSHNATVIAFLYSAIFMSLLAVGDGQRLIISDRGDPGQSHASKTDAAFFKEMFPKADHMVFQSPGVQEWYMANVGLKGTVIYNPIKDNLPQPYQGKRKKRIVNFCRLTPQKNLFLLLESFEQLVQEYPDYELYIYGSAPKNAIKYANDFLKAVSASACADNVYIFPARADIHEEILDYAMFVSSSDYEGMSNSMLEAMAIGLPTICTDCPAGGARAVIQDHGNGLLVPVNDANALYLAMKEIIENPELAEKLSQNSRKIRETQSSEKIMQQWMEIIND